MRRMNPQSLFDQRFRAPSGRLVRIYWAAPSGRRGLMFLFGAIPYRARHRLRNFLLSVGERSIMDSMQARNGVEFLWAVGFFAAVATGFVFVSARRLHLRQLVEIRWRERQRQYLRLWMSDRAYYQMHLPATSSTTRTSASRDIRDFVASALGLSLSLLAAVATLVWFGGLLWSLSRDWAFLLSGRIARAGHPVLGRARVRGAVDLAHASRGTSRWSGSTSTACAGPTSASR